MFTEYHDKQLKALMTEMWGIEWKEMTEINKIIQADVIEGLKTIPSESIDCCITSPPYWGLRDYGTAKWEGGDTNCHHGLRPAGIPSGNLGHGTKEVVYGDREICYKCGAKRIDKQIGLEKTPEEYVQKMVEVFREVRRVLKKEGTLWLNLGDSYYGGGWKGTALNEHSGAIQKAHVGTHCGQNISHDAKHPVIKPKDLVGIPWRVAFALQADGWWLRQDIIWSKPNPMPESITDRCTKSHEYVFLLAKSQHYYYDNEAIREPHIWADKDKRSLLRRVESSGKCESNIYATNAVDYHPNGRNKRSVWTITTKPFTDAHFATFPEDLVEPMIKAGTSEKGMCPDCGKAWKRIIERNNPSEEFMEKDARTLSAVEGSFGSRQCVKSLHRNDGGVYSNAKFLGWQSQCNCNKEPIPAIVLDPFCGSGTTCIVAKRLNRNYIGIELNPEYVKMAEMGLMSNREKDTMKTLKEIDAGKQKTLLNIMNPL